MCVDCKLDCSGAQLKLQMNVFVNAIDTDELFKRFPYLGAIFNVAVIIDSKTEIDGEAIFREMKREKRAEKKYRKRCKDYWKYL